MFSMYCKGIGGKEEEGKTLCSTSSYRVAEGLKIQWEGGTVCVHSRLL